MDVRKACNSPVDWPLLPEGGMRAAGVDRFLFRNFLRADFSWTGLGCARAVLVAAVIVLFASTGLWALDPQKQIGQYVHARWTSERGLPGEAVYQILQSKDGYLWVRTGSGLARFDGVRFVSMDAVIGNESVKAIAMGAEGDLLVRTNSKTLIYKNGYFSDYLPPRALPDGDIVTIFESRGHEVLLGSDDFIYLLQDTGTRMLRQGTGAVKSLVQDGDGGVWISGVDALYSYNHGLLSAPMYAWTGAHKHLYLSSLAVDHHLHDLWLGTSDGLYVKESKSSLLKRVSPNVVDDDILDIFEDHQDNLWMGTSNSGLVRKTADGKVSSFKSVDGLTDNTVLSIFEDREGGLWVGTASGLDHFRDPKLTTLTMKEGLPSNVARTIFESHSGELFAFCYGGRPAIIKNGQATEVSEKGGMPFRKGAVFESRDGSVWTNTDNGLGRFKDGKATIYRPDRLRNRYISAINEDDEGLIVATAEMVALRFKDGQVQPFTVRGQTTPLSTPGNFTFSIYRDHAGVLWFGTVKGLFRFAPGEDPMKSRQPGIDFPVTSISDDHRGSLWLGGRTPGLTRFRLTDGRVTHYRKKDGLFDDLLTRVLNDDQGNLWISTSSGIYMANRTDLDNFADGKVSTVRSVQYGTSDGMKSSEASLQTDQPAGWRASDGKLWFTTTKGLVVVDPNHIPQNEMIPPVVIESILVDDHLKPAGTDLQIAPGAGKIEFHYTALSLSIPERVRFKYQLQGYDRDWVDAGPRRVAYYTNLPPGKYSFRVIAANDDGVWNQQGAGVNLELEPRFYQTRIFFVACIVLALLIALAVNRISTRVIRNRAEELTRMVENRTAELVMSQRELEQLAHFDTLTSLPNRRMFTNDFGRLCELAKDGKFALLLIDCDKFKAINDTLGHDAGDAFLIEASRRLETAVRATDRVARLGGDEFAILLTGDHDEAGIGKACERIVQSFAVPVNFKGTNILTGVSIGVAVYPQDGNSAESLYKSADLALYEVKRQGGHNWRCYSPELREQRPLQPA